MSDYANMTTANKRAAVAVRLLGWVKQNGKPSGILSSMLTSPDGRLYGSAALPRVHGDNPGGWLGVVIDAMRKRGYLVSLESCDEPDNVAPFVHGAELRHVKHGRFTSGGMTLEDAILTAALLALDAEEAAHG